MRTTYTSSPSVFQRFLALAVVMIGLIVTSVSVSLVQVQKVSAASVGSGFCASTVNDSSGVIVTMASNGDCIVSFATAGTTGGNMGFSSRTWTIPAGVSSVNVLIVAGGGGGGSSNSQKTGGAGGGGGVVVATNYTVTPGASVAVTTGAGGSGGNCANGNRGGNSAFGSLTAIGGGWGSGCSATEGTGGSGGGGHHRVGARTTQTTSPGTSSNGVNITAYGNAGGCGNCADPVSGGGGGGGGATQVGGNGTLIDGVGTGGNGGEGIANSFRTDSPIVYGSGGGGGGNSVGGIGGTNAGNGCGTDTAGVGRINGVNETGGGGGGGMKCQLSAGRGGSGIVVVRYGLPALAQPSNVTAVATPSRGKSVDVSWTAVPNAQSYIVRLKSGTCDTVYGTKSGIIETSTTVTRFDMTGQTMEDNTTYKVTVAAVGDAVNYATSVDTQCISVTTNAPVATPTINTQPTSLYRTAGQNASLSVSASAADGGTLSYQWFKSGIIITGETSDTYSLTGVSTSDSGSYLVEVTNTLGGVSTSTISTTATLTVAGALSIATPTTGLSGTADSAFTLSVAGSGGRASLSYALTGTLVAGLSMSTSTGTISGTPSATGSSTVSVAVTDANGVTASTSNFTISVGYASTTVSLALASASPQYRLTNRITATTSRAGTVNFKLGGTSITGCEAVAAATTTATCDWEPVDLGVAALSAEFTPTASIYSNSTTSLSPTVLGRAITVTPYVGQSKVFGAAEPVIGYSITSGSLYGSETLTGALSRVAGEDAGSYAITAGNLYNTNYDVTLTAVNFTITQANQSAVVLTSISGVYATSLTLTASGGSGTGAYSFAVANLGTAGCSITSGVLNATSPGTCTVTATRALSTNYFVASSADTTVTVGKATQSVVTLTSTSGTFNTNISLTATGGTGSGSYSFSVSNAGTAGCTLPSATTLRSSGAGSCTVTATRAGDDYYEAKSSAATTVSFARDSQNLLSVRDVAGDLDTGITLSVSGGSGTGALSYSVTSGTASCSVASGVVSARYAGSCLLTTTKAADTNYSQAQITNTLTFIKATQASLVVTSVSGAYGSPITLITSGGSGSGTVSFALSDAGTALCSVSGSLLSFTAVGTCRVTATRDADSVFDSRSSSVTTITIDKANQPALSTAITSGDLVTGIIVSVTGGAGTGALSTSVTTGTANCTLVGGVVAARANGTCVLTISKLGDTNYNAASATVTLTFAKAAAARGTLGSPTSGTAGTGITLSFTGGSGIGAVTYAISSAGTAGCSITNGVLNAITGGKCSVVITKQGDDTYADQATTVEFTFTAPPSAPQGQSEVAAVTTTTSTTTTTVAPVVKKSKETPTTVAEAKVESQTSTTTTSPKSSMPIKQLVAPSLVNTPSAVGAATIGGKLAKATTTRVNNQLVFNAGGFTVTLAGVKADGTIIPLSSEGLLEVQRGDTFRLDVTGFAPGSNVDIWMFSKSMLLANITVGADGLVKSSFVVPKSMTDGLHHLVMVGVDKAKAEAKFEVGMNVGAPTKQWWASRVLIVIPIAVAVFIGLWLPTTVRRRKRRQVI
jgi:hypothetical protein